MVVKALKLLPAAAFAVCLTGSAAAQVLPVRSLSPLPALPSASLRSAPAALLSPSPSRLPGLGLALPRPLAAPPAALSGRLDAAPWRLAAARSSQGRTGQARAVLGRTFDRSLLSRSAVPAPLGLRLRRPLQAAPEDAALPERLDPTALPRYLEPRRPGDLGWRLNPVWRTLHDALDEAGRDGLRTAPRTLRRAAGSAEKLGDLDAYSDLLLRAANVNRNPESLVDWLRREQGC